jgi:very-short-patch-repair endonuclease
MPVDCQFCDTLLSSKQQKRKQKYCSRKCKSLSQEKRILLFCSGCKKQYLIQPYLRRSTNYCSVRCYLDATRLKKKRFCKRCGKKFLVKQYLIDGGFGIYCGRKCQFKDYPEKVLKVCILCNRKFKVQPARENKRKFCSKKCKDDFERDYIEAKCQNCLKIFQLSRADFNRGRGHFCSRDCFICYRGETSIEKKIRLALERSGVTYIQEAKIDYYRVDFLLSSKKIIIECDGVYWHKNSQLRDRRKNIFLVNKGYRVIRISENEINKIPEETLSKLTYGFKNFSQVEPGAYSLFSVIN